LPDGAVNKALFFPGLVVRHDFGFYKAAETRAEDLMFGGEQGTRQHLAWHNKNIQVVLYVCKWQLWVARLSEYQTSFLTIAFTQ
jgi:hypothetical protein